jgi:AcrR family transcriptional regulator
VSRSTFYAHFDNVEACLLAAHESASSCVLELASAGCEAEGGGAERLAAGVAAVLGFLREDPTMARLLSSEAAAGVPAIAASHQELTGRLAAMLRASRSPAPAGGGEIPVEQHLIGGAFALICELVAAGEESRLPGLAAELTELLSLRLPPVQPG